MTKDDLYQHPRSPVPPFEFDHRVARVFDDMIHRSIPFYDEIVERQVQFIDAFYQPGTMIYDLGCSNGNLGLKTCHRMGDRPFQMIAVDNSQPMLDAYRQRLASAPCRNRITLQCRDIGRIPLADASVVILNFTLQFLPPKRRDALTAQIYQGLNPNGIFLFSEKVTHDNNTISDLQQKFYHAFKRENGYSELEISQKREALEKVLVPETMEQHFDRLRWAGFQTFEVWHKWFNFASLIAIK